MSKGLGHRLLLCLCFMFVSGGRIRQKVLKWKAWDNGTHLMRIRTNSKAWPCHQSCGPHLNQNNQLKMIMCWILWWLSITDGCHDRCARHSDGRQTHASKAPYNTRIASTVLIIQTIHILYDIYVSMKSNDTTYFFLNCWAGKL